MTFLTGSGGRHGVGLEFCSEDVPRTVDAGRGLGSCDDDAAGGEDEHDDGGVDGAVDEAGEHGALEGALDVVLAVEAVEVERLVVEVHVDVADDVLHLDVGDLEEEAREAAAEDVDDAVAGEDAGEEVAASGEDHFAGGEEQDGGVGVGHAYGDGSELFFFECAVGHDAVYEVEVEGSGAAEDHGRADDVVHHGGAGARDVAIERVVHVDRACGGAEGVCQFLGDAAPATHVDAHAGKCCGYFMVEKKKEISKNYLN